MLFFKRRRKYVRSIMNCQIIVCTANHPSRIHYPENKKPRVANSRYDFLFSTERGRAELYDPEKHGIRGIRKDEYGKLVVAQAGLEETPGDETGEITEEERELLFPLESHLRDFIAQNIEVIKVNDHNLRLHIDENGRDGVEYPTDVGPIDISALDLKYVASITPDISLFEYELNFKIREVSIDEGDEGMGNSG